MTVTNIHDTATDADAVYIKLRISDADRHDASAAKHDTDAAVSRRAAAEARLEAGRRLIEVKLRVTKSPDGRASGDFHNGWTLWLQNNDIPETTARRLMTLAGYTEEQRQEHRDKEAERKREERARQKQEAARYGWIAALQRFSGMNQQWGGSQKRFIEKHMGPISDSMTEEEARLFAERVRQLFEAENQEQKKEDHGLNKKEQTALEKAIRAEIAKLQNEAAALIEKAVKERTAEVIENYKRYSQDVAKKLADGQESLDKQSKHINEWMTKDEFMLIIGCLHPDRAPSGMEERYRKAFQIMNQLKDKFK